MNVPARLFAILLGYCVLSSSLSADAAISISKIGEWQATDSAMPFGAAQLNFRAHQDDAIVSFNGYQYCTFYSIIGSDTDKRYVTVGRRKLPDGEWEKVVLTDYTQTTDDAHNIISLGLCEGDGTLHLAFDHHNKDLNYRISVQGLATNPEAHSWTANKFNPTQDYLPGQDMGRTTGLTYPRFFPKPNGDLQFVRRKGSAIAGKNMIYTYKQSTHLWDHHGVYVDGTIVLYDNDAGETTKLNPYLHGIGYDDNERLHISWVWRTTDGKNFDFSYAYSDDYGINWKNNTGQHAGRTNGDPITYMNDVLVEVFDFPEGSMLNQTGQCIDSEGRVHVVQKDGAKFRHIYRDTDGNWHHNRIDSIGAGRYKITTDQFNNVYLMTSSAKVYAATPENNFNDWAIAYDGDAGRFGGDAQFDDARMKREGILTLICQTPASGKDVYSIDLLVSPISKTAPTYGNGGTPGSGDPWLITRSTSTRIEAENYDQGDAGIVFSDTTEGNTGGAYRTNDVDISSSSDAGGGYQVGWTKAGEWLQYTVDVEQSGLYDLTLRYSRENLATSALRVTMNGANISGMIDAPGTGSWGTYTSLTTQVELQSGEQGMRLHFDDGSINVNWFEITPIDAPIITMATLNSMTPWDAAATWDDANPAHGQADYVVPASGNLISPNVTSSFPGYSLTVESGGKFQVRSTEADGEVITVNSLLFSDGTGYTSGNFSELSAGTGGNQTNVLDGSINNAGYLRILSFDEISSGPLNRSMKILSRISGTGHIQAWEGSGGKGGDHVIIDNDANTFSGTWETGTGSTLIFANSGSIGAADIDVLDTGKLKILGNWQSAGTLAISDTATTQVDLGIYTWSVSNVVFGGVSLDDGDYDTAELNALGSNPVFIGNGTLKVGAGDPRSPVAHWKLDEASGTTATDASGNGYDGALLNGVAWGSDATRATYASFDGTDDRIATDFMVDITGEESSFTWCAWVNNQATADTAVILGNRYPTIDGKLNFFKLTPTRVDYYGGGSGQRLDTDPMPLNEWHHYAVVKSGSAIDYYVDGLLVDQRGITKFADGLFPFFIGGDPEGNKPSEHFEGFVDDVVLYDLALTSNEVVNVKNGIYGGSDPVEPPMLDFGMSSGDMVFNWTGSGFKVQSCTNLTEGTWIDVPDGDTPPVTNSTTEPEAFFRLIEQ